MLIDYQNVSIYQADKCVLKGINFHVDEGEFAYLIGKVGSGKSSLLKTLYCELDLVEGETDKAEILGRDLKTIRRKDIPALRKELGIIFQDFQLLHDRSVRKNFEFVLKATKWKNKKDRDKRIEEVLNEVGMIEKIDKMLMSSPVENSSVWPSPVPCSTIRRSSSPMSQREISTQRPPATSWDCSRISPSRVQL